MPAWTQGEDGGFPPASPLSMRLCFKEDVTSVTNVEGVDCDNSLDSTSVHNEQPGVYFHRICRDQLLVGAMVLRLRICWIICLLLMFHSVINHFHLSI